MKKLSRRVYGFERMTLEAHSFDYRLEIKLN